MFKKQLIQKRLVYLYLAIAAVLIFSIGILTQSSLNPTIVDQTPKVAIVDHLSTSQPNPSFSQSIEAITNKANLQVDYYPSEQVTVDLYKNLPLHNYKIIILRVHSSAHAHANVTTSVEDFVVFFTSEEYSTFKYIHEQQTVQLGQCSFANDEALYFGVTPLFIESGLAGRFNDTIIIAMGCEGMKYSTMAQAFVDRGARAYIGWNGSVMASHTDEATTHLINNLLIGKQDIQEAVTNTMKEVGPDSAYNSVLLFYPDGAGSHHFTLSAHGTVIIADVAREVCGKRPVESE